MNDSARQSNLEPPSCAIYGLRAEDTAGAAALHRVIFPDYFLTHMGQWFVERFYSEFVDRSGNYGFVAVCDDELAGSVIGTLDPERLYSGFYRRRLPGLALVLAWRFVVDPYIRRNLGGRIGHVRQAFRSLRTRGWQVSRSTDPSSVEHVPARLLSIGVHPDWRGSGIAEQLVDRYCDELWREGIAWVGLTVRPENQGAIAFYERAGWQKTDASATAVSYTRATQPRSAAGGGGP